MTTATRALPELDQATPACKQAVDRGEAAHDDWFLPLLANAGRPRADGTVKVNKKADNAIEICLSCPLMVACLEGALDAEDGLVTSGRHGIRGGMTHEERYIEAMRREGVVVTLGDRRPVDPEELAETA